MAGAQVALISFVASDRQWFKARIGLDQCQTPLSQSVCALAIQQPGLFVIPDLSLDPRTRHNALVAGEPRIRFYAGARLDMLDGTALGTLCVIDTEPRPAGLTEVQATSLEALARQVMVQLELRTLHRSQGAELASTPRKRCASRRRWRRSASSPAASPMTSTIC